MAEALLSREQVDESLKWNLGTIYESEDALNLDLEKAKALCEQIEEYKGKLDTANDMVVCVDLYRDFYEIYCRSTRYVDLSVTVDYTNRFNQKQNSRVHNLMADLMSRLSFMTSELSQASESEIEKAANMNTEYKGFFENILREKPHMLHPEAEKVLAAFAHTMGLPYEIYNITKMGDINFEDFEVDGKKYPLGYCMFEDDYEYLPDTKVRRAAYRAFSDKIKQYENVTAAAFNGFLQQKNVMAKLRGFKSITEMDAFEKHVTVDLYHRQIDVIMEKLAPHMRKYAKLIQKIYHLDQMTYADLKLPVDADYAPTVTMDEAKSYIKDALSVLGNDYAKMIDQAFEERWIDFAQNKGKSTGGFCECIYKKQSFILMTWNQKMSDVFTLAHELGHAGQAMLTDEHQCIFDTDMSCYFVEAPSTTNELLMTHYLLKQNTEPRFRRWVLSSMVGNTYYHNFVTHLLEAAYQRKVYELIEAGGSVDADILSRFMKEVLEQFWGDSVVLIDGAEHTWMRQPHYYSGLYSYTYSAGLTVGTQMCKRIEKEGISAIEDWKKVLAAGGTKNPIELAALGGIDITTDEALEDTINIIGQYIDEICALTEELSDC